MSAPSPGPPRPWRIVASDDDPELLARVVNTLRNAGHCVFSAYDGDSACELALLVPDIHLLITNTRLGTGSAQELIRCVREQKPELPILHVGEPWPDPEPLLHDVPSLLEPFTEDQLLAAARALVSRRRSAPPESR